MRVPSKSGRRGPQRLCKRVGGPQLMRQQVWPGLVPALRLPWVGRQAGRWLAPALFQDVFVCERQHYLFPAPPIPTAGRACAHDAFRRSFASGWRPGWTAPWRLCALRHVPAGPAPSCRAAE